MSNAKTKYVDVPIKSRSRIPFRFRTPSSAKVSSIDIDSEIVVRRLRNPPGGRGHSSATTSIIATTTTMTTTTATAKTTVTTTIYSFTPTEKITIRLFGDHTDIFHCK